MPGEKQNEISNKLNGMNSIPQGFRFDSDQTWQKLDAEMHGKPKRKLIFWLPAAVLLSAVIGGTVYFQVKSSHPNKDTRVTTLHPSKQQKQTPVEKEIVQLTNAKHIPVLKSAEQRQRIPFEEKEIAQDTLVAFPAVTQVSNVLQDNLKDTVVAVASSVQKPRFKIAHVNELDVPVTTLPSSPKANTVLLIRKTNSTPEYNESSSVEEKVIAYKKQKTLIASLINSSQ
jgi:hypothetical protein